METNNMATMSPTKADLEEHIDFHLNEVRDWLARSAEQKSLLGQLAQQAGPEDGCTVD